MNTWVLHATSAELRRWRRAGLVEEVAPGVFALTHAGRVLSGEKPPGQRVESVRTWLARVDALRVGRRRFWP